MKTIARWTALVCLLTLGGDLGVLESKALARGMSHSGGHGGLHSGYHGGYHSHPSYGGYRGPYDWKLHPYIFYQFYPIYYSPYYDPYWGYRWDW